MFIGHALRKWVPQMSYEAFRLPQNPIPIIKALLLAPEVLEACSLNQGPSYPFYKGAGAAFLWFS